MTAAAHGRALFRFPESLSINSHRLRFVPVDEYEPAPAECRAEDDRPIACGSVEALPRPALANALEAIVAQVHARTGMLTFLRDKVMRRSAGRCIIDVFDPAVADAGDDEGDEDGERGAPLSLDEKCALLAALCEASPHFNSFERVVPPQAYHACGKDDGDQRRAIQAHFALVRAVADRLTASHAGAAQQLYNDVAAAMSERVLLTTGGAQTENAGGCCTPMDGAPTERWSPIMRIKVISAVLQCEPRLRTVKKMLARLGSEIRAIGREQFRVRLDSMDVTYRRRFEASQ